MKVNNKELFLNLLPDFTVEDLTWYCQIIKRKKDHPDGQRNSSARLIRPYYFKCKADMEQVWDEMVAIAEAVGARIMMDTNPKHSHRVKYAMIKNLCDQIEDNTNNKIHRLYNVLYGKMKAAKGTSTFVIDWDSMDTTPLDLAISMVNRCEAVIKLTMKVPTVQGVHYIVEAFDLNLLTKTLAEIGVTGVDIHKNSPSLVYVNIPKSQVVGADDIYDNLMEEKITMDPKLFTEFTSDMLLLSFDDLVEDKKNLIAEEYDKRYPNSTTKFNPTTVKATPAMLDGTHIYYVTFIEHQDNGNKIVTIILQWNDIEKYRYNPKKENGNIKEISDDEGGYDQKMTEIMEEEGTPSNPDLYEGVGPMFDHIDPKKVTLKYQEDIEMAYLERYRKHLDFPVSEGTLSADASHNPILGVSGYDANERYWSFKIPVAWEVLNTCIKPEYKAELEILSFSDCHGDLPTIEKADIVTISGDIFPATNHSPVYQERWYRETFVPWVENIDGKVILVPGNHDFLFQSDVVIKKPRNLTILIDEEVTIYGIKFYGTPWSSRFGNWAFMAGPKQLVEIFAKIPNDIDVLLCHAAPDLGNIGVFTKQGKKINAGCKELAEAIKEKTPKLVLCGHLHEAGRRHYEGTTLIQNVSIKDDFYKVCRDLYHFTDKELVMQHIDPSLSNAKNGDIITYPFSDELFKRVFDPYMKSWGVDEDGKFQFFNYKIRFQNREGVIYTLKS